MSLEEAILATVRRLPADKQREVLEYAGRLTAQAESKRPFRSMRGLWADLGVSLSAEEMDANQEEMWRNFPRGDI